METTKHNRTLFWWDLHAFIFTEQLTLGQKRMTNSSWPRIQGFVSEYDKLLKMNIVQHFGYLLIKTGNTVIYMLLSKHADASEVKGQVQTAIEAGTKPNLQRGD